MSNKDVRSLEREEIKEREDIKEREEIKEVNRNDIAFKALGHVCKYAISDLSDVAAKISEVSDFLSALGFACVISIQHLSDDKPIIGMFCGGKPAMQNLVVTIANALEKFDIKSNISFVKEDDVEESTE